MVIVGWIALPLGVDGRLSVACSSVMALSLRTSAGRIGLASSTVASGDRLRHGHIDSLTSDNSIIEPCRPWLSFGAVNVRSNSEPRKAGGHSAGGAGRNR